MEWCMPFNSVEACRTMYWFVINSWNVFNSFTRGIQNLTWNGCEPLTKCYDTIPWKDLTRYMGWKCNNFIKRTKTLHIRNIKRHNKRSCSFHQQNTTIFDVYWYQFTKRLFSLCATNFECFYVTMYSSIYN